MNNKTLLALYEEHDGKVSDKWSSYLHEYDRLFSDYRDRPIRLLEIGIQNGGSLELWAKYFTEAQKLVGCDIDPKCEALHYDDSRIAVVVADANQDAGQQAILAHSSAFDLIIDDGSHQSSDVVRSFARYFPVLSDGGLYIVEDLHCGYWKEFDGGLFHPYSSVALFKHLADIVNREHWGVDKAPQDLLAGLAKTYEVSLGADLLSHIHSVEFINSVCVVRKCSPGRNELGLRYIAGEDALVENEVVRYTGSVAVALDQTDNPYSTRLRPPAEELPEALEELAAARHLAQDTEAELEAIRLESERLHAELQAKNKQLVEATEHVSLLKSLVDERDRSSKALSASVEDKTNRIKHLETQQGLLNAELLRLNAQQHTSGAIIGRRLTALRARVAPVGTRRGAIAGLAAKFASKLLATGVKNTVKVTLRYLWFGVRSGLSRRGALGRPVFNADGDGTVPAGGQSQFDAVAPDRQFAAWISAHEPDAAMLAQQAEVAKRFAYAPLISVIIPVYKVPAEVLSATLACLEQQTYSNWEACLVWADTEDTEGWLRLQARTAADERYRLRLLESNGGISLNSNQALELASGEYIALLDHDDTLAPWALFEMVETMQTRPELDFIYSDKDCITEEGRLRLNALFKPSWSPEMLHSVNYLTHLNVMRTRIVREIGGWNPDTDGAQDWDIFFRVTERTDQIARIPSIHYHWRILATSVASGLQAKPYAAMGQLRAQQDHFMRQGLNAAVAPTDIGLFQVKWPRRDQSADVIVYEAGAPEELATTLRLLVEARSPSIRQLHVVHTNPPSAALRSLVQAWGDTCLLHQAQAPGWRQALECLDSATTAEAIVLLDGRITELDNELVHELAGWAGQHPDIAWCGAIALSRDETVFEAGRVVGKRQESAPLFHGSPLYSFGWLGGPLWYRNTQACSPYAVAIKRADLRRALEASSATSAPGAEPSFVQLCLLLNQGGKRGLINPFAKAYFRRAPETQWPNDGALYHDDPYFHPAFTQVSPLRLIS